MRWLRQRASRPPDLPPLLGAEILVTDHHAYAVEIDRLNQQVQSVEFVRLVLHYFAEVLYRYGSGDHATRTAVELRMTMTRVCAEALRASRDLLQAAGLGGVATVGETRPATGAHRIQATLYFVSLAHRGMRAEFPERLPARQATGSVFVLMHRVLAHLSPEDCELLGKALNNMQAMYSAGYEYTDAQNLSLVPNEALGMG